MKKIILIIIIVNLFSCKTIKVKEGKDEVIVGKIDREIFDIEPYKSWFKKKYNSYELKDAVVSDITKNLEGVKIKAFIGLWCSDSKQHTPTLYKLLDNADFQYSNLELISVDKKKRAKGLEKGFDIFRVPTFIFYKNNKELGRFVELPVESLEEDFMKIISGKQYKHFYDIE